MNRREFFIALGLETLGVAATGAGIADRITTPTPPFEGNAVSDPVYTINYNVNNRLRSSLLIAAGVSLLLTPIAVHFSSRYQQRRIDQSPNSPERMF